MEIERHKQHLLDQIIELLKPIPGVQAVVLGGSYARGTARPDSDLDIGIYYSETAPFAIPDLQKAASVLSGKSDQEVTNFYAWGAWVNGGGWIHTPVCKIDFIFRNLEQVQRTISEAHQGITHHDFDQQSAYGFYSVIYLAETNICQPLYDPHGHITRLKTQVISYPPILKEKTVVGNLWMAEFSLLHADNFAASGNVYTTVGCLTRVASFLTQALFALNETYFMSDKTATQKLSAFALVPTNYIARLSNLLGCPGQSAADLQASVHELRSLWTEAVALTHGVYRPAFKL